MADRIGQQMGNYRLIRLLGRGGEAEVYLGEHIHFKRKAAIKVLHAILREDQKADFVMEAQRMVDLSHPSIIPVFDFAIESGFPYLIMEYAPDGTLRTRHPKGSHLSLETVVSYVKRIATPLQYMHGQKLVHRDVKPENLLVGRNQEILLSDFGIAAIAHRTNSLSIQGQAGTPPYMAPEQLQGRPHAASDQYALAIVAYEWLCGTVPFQGSTIAAIVAQHLTIQPPSLLQQVPTLPPAVEQVILKALAKRPQQRFRTITEFALALEEASQPTQAIPAVSPLKQNQVPLDISNVPTVLLAEPEQNQYLPGREGMAFRDTQPLVLFPQHVGLVRGLIPIANNAISRPVPNASSAPRSQTPSSSLPAKANVLWKRQGLSYTLGSLPLIVLITSVLIAIVARYIMPSYALKSPTPLLTTTAQQNFLATDTFDRPNQALWGTASDGQQWSIDPTDQPYFSINDGTGIISGGQEPLEAVIGQATANVDVTVTGSINQFGTNVNLGIVLRWTDPSNWYKADFDGTQLVILKCVNGQKSVIGEKAVSVSAGTWQILRFGSYRTTLSAKVWSSNDSQPADWQVSIDDHTFTTGRFGIRVSEQSTTMIRVKSFDARKGTKDQDT